MAEEAVTSTITSRDGARGISAPTSSSSQSVPPKPCMMPFAGTSKEAREAVDAAQAGEPAGAQGRVERVEGGPWGTM